MNNTDKSTLVRLATAEIIESKDDEGRAVQESGEVIQEARKVGKPKHRIWKDVFDDPDIKSINQPNHAVCKYFKETIRHHHKTLSVETHLQRLGSFKKLILDIPVVEIVPIGGRAALRALQKTPLLAKTRHRFQCLGSR